MSADVLRRAAAVLRERATVAADAAPPPWYIESDGDGDGWLVLAPDPESRIPFDVTRDVHDRGLAAYIATMHPGVGHALALILALAADHEAGRGKACGSCVEHAIDLARAVLGESA